MIWREDYCIGEERIDSQHQALFMVLNRILRILDHKDNERDKRACIEAIKFLKSYTLNHFNDEEQYQLQIGYKGYPQHKQQHEAFKSTIADLEKNMVENDFAKDSVRRFVGILSSWLVYHIMDSDQAITGYHIHSEHTGGAAMIMEQIIGDAFSRMFRVNVVMGNANYKGGFTGSEIFCAADIMCGDEKLQVLIAMDENVAVTITANMLDIKLDGANELVLSAVQELSMLLAIGFAQQHDGGKPCRVDGISIIEADAERYTEQKNNNVLSMLFNAPMGNLVVKVVRA